MTAEDRFPSYRTPQTEGANLCVPPWPAVRSELEGNREAIATSVVEIAGMPLADLARDARQTLFAQAQTYTRSYANVPKTAVPETTSDVGPLILTGHQPELIHPGVWLKNFAAGQLAHEVGGTAINLVIDNDLCRSPSIRVPTGTVEQPQVVDFPLDQLQQEMPYEERTIVDRALWNSFGGRVTSALAPLVSEPLLAEWWPEVVAISETASSDKAPKLGLAIAQARHRLQQRWGNRSLELPQSQVCQTAPFRRFALHLLTHADRFRRDYNGALAEYRLAHRLRSPAQPLPDLAKTAGWTETPFWIWTQDHPLRRALFVKRSGTRLQLSDRQDWHGTLELGKDDQVEGALQQLEAWQHQGVKLRTRALLTTLYARLLLADTFIHGIGGAKYDQVTDLLCQQFFGIEPPKYVALSGTLRLPIAHASVSPTRVSELRQALRGLQFHPESSLCELVLNPTEQGQVDRWITQKRRWVQTAKTKSNAAHRHLHIVAANEALQPWLLPQQQQLQHELVTTLAQTRKNKLLESREYAFCLFPADQLRKFLLAFSPPMP